MQGFSASGPDRHGSVLAAAVGVGLCVSLLSVPMVLAGWSLSPDSNEYLQIAHAWSQGAGFVDPVQWGYLLDRSPPLPGFAVRPPLVSVLAALPFRLGAEVRTVLVLHCLWAGLVAAAVVLAAGRLMRPAAALAAGLFFGTSPLWLGLARVPLSETTAVAAYLGVLVTLPLAVRSVPGALLCAAATLLAWLARPNLGALVLAVPAAVLWSKGLRAGLRSPAFWCYVPGFALLMIAIQAVAQSSTGLTLYAGYSGEALSYDELLHYGKEYVGTWGYVQAHAGEIREILPKRAAQYGREMFLRPTVTWAGWLLAPGIVWALARRRDGRTQHAFNALSGAGFSLIVMLNYVAAEKRYALLPALCATLVGFAMLDALARRIETRLGSPRSRLAVSTAVLAAVILLVSTTAARNALPRAAEAWARHQETGTREPVSPLSELCARINPNAIVASSQPWGTSLFCGNASIFLPLDLSDAALRDRFFRERSPAYFVAPAGGDFAWLARDSRVRREGRAGPFRLYRVIDPAPASIPWQAPPPLVCAGREPDCARRPDPRP